MNVDISDLSPCEIVEKFSAILSTIRLTREQRRILVERIALYVEDIRGGYIASVVAISLA